LRSLTVFSSGKRIRALDVGCAVGRHSFELAKAFDEVIGLDFSHAFVAACEKMKADRIATVPLWIQGDIRSTVTVSLPPQCTPHAAKTRFVQGDACALPSLGRFDCVLAANLLCRLPTPVLFLEQLPELINKVQHMRCYFIYTG
jgi:SAM-dependent methyltransferase